MESSNSVRVNSSTLFPSSPRAKKEKPSYNSEVKVTGTRINLSGSHLGNKSRAFGASNPVNSYGYKLIPFIVSFIIFLVVVPILLAKLSAVSQQFALSINFTVERNNSETSKPTLLKDKYGLTNVLIVGIDTRAYGEDSSLKNTDTIILASYNHVSHQLTMTSFPRDLYVQYPSSSSYGKINSVYANGELRKKGSGMETLVRKIETISGRKIQYYGVIDLKGFTKAIDLLGGIEVNVERTFTGSYPNDKNQWADKTFKKGVTKMDGKTALIYARIRYANEAAEMGDFARARRQQKVIQAVIDKVVKQSYSSPAVVFDSIRALASYIRISRVTPEDISAVLSIMAEKGKPTMYSIVLDPEVAGGSLIMVGGYGYGYTLNPKAGLDNWKNVRTYISDYTRAPALFSSRKEIMIINSSNTGSMLKNLRSKFNSLKFEERIVSEVPEVGIYRVGNKEFESGAMFLSAELKLPYKGVYTGIGATKDTVLVVVY